MPSIQDRRRALAEGLLSNPSLPQMSPEIGWLEQYLANVGQRVNNLGGMLDPMNWYRAIGSLPPLGSPEAKQVFRHGGRGLLDIAMDWGVNPIAGGLLGTFKGMNAKLSDDETRMLQKAFELEQQGMGREAIRQATNPPGGSGGWFRDPIDKKWRIEMDDSAARMTDEATGLWGAQNLKEGRKAQQVFQHPDLYRAYPELADIPVSSNMPRGLGTASWLGMKQGVELDPGFLARFSYKNPDEISRAMLHEIGGHGVQSLEGFTPGSSALSAPDNAKQVFGKTMEKLNDMLAQGGAKLDDLPTWNDIPMGNIPPEGVSDAYQRFDLTRYLSNDNVPAYEKLLDELDAAAPKYRGPKENYLLAGGEAWARLIEARRKLTPAQRAALDPIEQMDTMLKQEGFPGGIAELRGGVLDEGPAMSQAIPDELPAGAPAERMAQGLLASPSQISTRFPTAVRATEDPMTHGLLANYDAARMDPEAFAHNVNLMADYPQIRTRAKTPKGKAESIIEFQRDNLNWLYNMVPPEIRQQTSQWYEGANRIAREAAEKYNITKEQAAGVYAALSPQKDWYQNVSLGDRVMDAIRGGKDLEWTSAMGKRLKEISGNLKSPAARLAQERVPGRSLGELKEPGDRALWVRLYDEAHGNRGYQKISPTGERGDFMLTQAGDPAITAWGGIPTIASAIQVLDNPSLENISRLMGQQHKVRSFYNNIVDPWSPRGDVTIDTHAVAAGLLSPYAASDAAVLHNFGSGLLGQVGPKSSAITGIKGTYPINAEAYQRAASDAASLPRQMQSVTWEAIRGLFDNKSPAIKAAANDVWGDYKRGLITQSQAQRKIYDLAGGINPPTWLAR